MGGGRAKFMPNNVQDPEYTAQNGSRKDGRNLVQVPIMLCNLLKHFHSMEMD
jgi:hypothetical protein